MPHPNAPLPERPAQLGDTTTTMVDSALAAGDGTIEGAQEVATAAVDAAGAVAEAGMRVILEVFGGLLG
jgi:hypothetical protein